MKTLTQKLSLSLPVREVKHLKSSYKKRGFDSISSYIIYLIGLDNSKKNMISEDELLELAEEAKKEYERGECLTANSITELL
jgi:hypothetical protein